MKIRKGFVSNSSSSSFVVVFPRKPKSVEDVKEMMFGGVDENLKIDYFDEYFSTQQISETVFNDIKSQKPNSLKAISQAIGGGYSEYSENLPDLDDYKMESGHYDWDAFQKEYEKCSHLEARKFIKENKKSDETCVYTFEYSDNDGHYFCFLEHGGIFDNLPNIRISNH